jgi:hypothetical protein
VFLKKNVAPEHCGRKFVYLFSIGLLLLLLSNRKYIFPRFVKIRDGLRNVIIIFFLTRGYYFLCNTIFIMKRCNNFFYTINTIQYNYINFFN